MQKKEKKNVRNVKMQNCMVTVNTKPQKCKKRKISNFLSSFLFFFCSLRVDNKRLISKKIPGKTKCNICEVSFNFVSTSYYYIMYNFVCEYPTICEHNKNTHNSVNFQARSRSKVVEVAVFHSLTVWSNAYMKFSIFL